MTRPIPGIPPEALEIPSVPEPPDPNSPDQRQAIIQWMRHHLAVFRVCKSAPDLFKTPSAEELLQALIRNLEAAQPPAVTPPSTEAPDPSLALEQGRVLERQAVIKWLTTMQVALKTITDVSPEAAMLSAAQMFCTLIDGLESGRHRS